MHKPAHITQVNGVDTSAIDIADRGLAYGDGLFETMRVVNGRIPLYEYHLERLAKGVEVLRMGPVEALLEQFDGEVQSVLEATKHDAVLKVIVTRGRGGRGYQPPEEARIQIVSQLFDAYGASKGGEKGARLNIAQYRMGLNPSLAGIKHLNRLDQVLVAEELLQINQHLNQEQRFDELLVCSIEDCVIEGSKSNLLLFNKDRVVTPGLERCGVSGTLRDALMATQAEHGVTIEERVLSLGDLEQYSAMAICNSIIGLRPVKFLGDRELSFDKRCDQLQHFLNTKFSYPY